MKFVQQSLSWLTVALAGAAIHASDVIDVAESTTSNPGTPVVLLAIDDDALPLRDNVCLYLSKPALRQEAVLTPERTNKNAPDQLAAHFYGTVIKDGDRFRMWYYGSRQAGGRWKVKGYACYAESDDGIQWTKPKLGQVEIGGSTENNGLALVDVETQGVTVIKDEADHDADRRYKMVVQYMPRDYPTLKRAVSQDGVRWTLLDNLPARQFREQASFFKHGGKYIVCGHTPSNGESGHSRGRQGFAWISPDFDYWPIEQVESFLLPEPPPADGWRWDHQFDQVHLGVGAASFGNVAVGLYGLWHQRGWGESGTSCDLGLVVSTDGVHFREPVPGHKFIAADATPAPPVEGKQFPTILCQANGILNVGDETRIYYGRWRNSEWPLQGEGLNYYADIALATLPRDRWGGVGLVPGTVEGSVWSAPIRIPNGECVISLNADGADGMRIELATADFQPLPAFSADQAGVCDKDDGLSKLIRWPSGKLKDLAGQSVRLHVLLKKKSADPKLYAIYLTTNPNTKPKAE